MPKPDMPPPRRAPRQAQGQGGLLTVRIPGHRRGPVEVQHVDGSVFRIPPGHFPPPGACRIWHPHRPPGQQPPPGACSDLERRVPPGAYLVYG